MSRADKVRKYQMLTEQFKTIFFVWHKAQFFWGEDNQDIFMKEQVDKAHAKKEDDKSLTHRDRQKAAPCNA